MAEPTTPAASRSVTAAMPSGSTRIVLADDHRMFREALRGLLNAEPDLRVVGEAADGAEAIAQTHRLQPDILLLDVGMPGMKGLDALRQLAPSATATRVILLTAAIDQADVVAALRLGVRGVILKESGSALLLKGIRGVRDGEYWVERQALADFVGALQQATGTRDAPGRVRDFGLTSRELQIVATVVAAYSNKDIAAKFSISEKTVKHHLTNVFNKLGVSNRLELALFAMHHQLPVHLD